VESRLEDWVFQHDYAERILREQFGVAELTGFAWMITRKLFRGWSHRSLPP